MSKPTLSTSVLFSLLAWLSVFGLRADDSISSPIKLNMAADNSVIKTIIDQYASLPNIKVSFQYSAIADKDYAFYRESCAKILGQKPPFDSTSEKQVAPGSILAQVDGQFMGNLNQYSLELIPKKSYSGYPLRFQKSTDALYDGTSYLVKATPGSYTSLQADYDPIITPYGQIFESLPLTIPSQIVPIPSDTSESYANVLKDLVAAKDTSLNIGHDAMGLGGFIHRRPGDGNQEAAQSVKIILIKQAANWVIKRIDLQNVVFENGQIVRTYGRNKITFDNYVKIGSVLIPKTISLSCVSSLLDYKGNDDDTNAHILGISAEDLENKTYDVLTHKYTCSDIEVLPATQQPFLTFNKGDVIYNRFTEEYIHIPETMNVSSIQNFVNESKTFVEKGL